MKDWPAFIRQGYELARDEFRSTTQLDDHHAMWGLFCAAVRDTERAYRGMPGLGMPGKSAGFEGGPEISVWHQVAAYLRGEIEEMPQDQGARLLPSAYEISRGAIVIDAFQAHALKTRADGKRLRKALFMRAKGMKPAALRSLFAVDRYQLRHAKDEAMRDMVRAAIGRDDRHDMAAAMRDRGRLMAE